MREPQVAAIIQMLQIISNQLEEILNEVKLTEAARELRQHQKLREFMRRKA